MARIKQMSRRPGFQDLTLSCANCGHDKFRIHVHPYTIQGESPGADVTEIVCDKCERMWKTDAGCLMTSGKVKIEKEA